MSSCLKYAVVLLVLTAGSLQASEWYQDYQKGQKAADHGKCGEAVPVLLDALRKNPRPDLKARPYGTQLWEYIPHYYLTKCALESGDYVAAKSYIKAAEQGNIYASSKATEFRAMKEMLQTKLGEGKQPPVNKPVILPQDSTTKKPVAVPPPVIEQPKPAQIPEQKLPEQNPEQVRQSLITKILNEANDALQKGNYEEAKSAINRALALDRNNPEAIRLLTQITKRQGGELEANRKEARLNEARRMFRGGNLAAAETLVIQLQQEYPSDSSIASLLEEIQRRKQAQLKNLADEDSRKFIEKQVLLAYYTGKYDAVIQLAGQGISSHPDSWRLYFFQGCAETALALLNHENRDERLGRAKESFRKAKQLAGNITVPPQISPKIVQVYRSS
jgi:tetratricopeptide (TPR) repeat protein